MMIFGVTPTPFLIEKRMLPIMIGSLFVRW